MQTFTTLLERLRKLLTIDLECMRDLLPQLVAALAIAILFYFLARGVRSLLRSRIEASSASNTTGQLVANFAYIGVWMLGLLAILGVLGLDKTFASLLAGAGVAGILIGFAFKDIAANYLSGVLLALVRPFEVGDLIKIEGHMGRVLNIGLFRTEIETFDGQRALIPNADSFSQSLLNYSKSGKRRIVLQIGVSYGDDLELVERVTREALQSLDRLIPEEPVDVLFEEFGSSSINLLARVWVRTEDGGAFFEVRHEMVKAVKRAYDQNGVTIPFPIRTLDFGIKGGQPLERALRVARDEA